MARIKNINTRIQLKNDTENNWNKAKAEEGKDGFIPLLGEAIVYMGENGHGPRIKIGDGETNVTELPFLEDNDTVYTASNGIEITAENIIQHINNLDVSPSEIGFYKIKYDLQGHINGATAVSKQDILNLLQMTPGRIDSVQITAEAPLVSSNSTENITNLVTNISFSSQGKNTVLAGPTQSATGAPSFRLLTQDDIPDLSASKITEGHFSAERIDNLPASKITSGVFDVNRIPNLEVNKITGIIPVSQGGTGVDGVNGNLENNIPSFFNNGVFVYDAINTRFKQFSITALGNTDTFTSYVNSLNGATENLLIDLDTLIRAIPPMNLANPAIKYDENQEIKQSYKPSYYSPTTKGIKNSVLISDGDGDSNEDGLEPIWLDPTILSTEGHYGGALFYGRDNDSEDLIKPFKTQWGTLPVEQGGTGNTSFNIGQVLIGSGKNSITTIEKTDLATSNTIVQRDINGDFATHSITLIKSLLSESFNTNFPNRNIIDIDNNNIATFFGILNANNLKATIGEIEMSCSLSGDNTKQSKIKWYNPESTTQLIGELYWDNISKRGILKNYYLSENLVLQSDAYYLPEVNTSSTTNNNFTLLATEDTVSNMFPVNSVLYSNGKVNKITYKNSANGALYSTSVNGALEWGTLPVAQGGTGVTTIANIQAGKDGNGDTISSTYLKLIGGTMTGDIIFASIGDSESTGTANGISWSGSSDGAKIDYTVPSSDLGILRLNVIDDANDRISLRNRNVEYFRVDGSTGATIQGQTSESTAYNSTNPKLTFMNSDGSKNGQLIWNDYDSQQAPASLTLIGNQGEEYFIAPNIKATGNFYGYLQGTASNNVLKSGDTMTGPLSITPPSGEGGEIALDAPGDNATQNGITIDNYSGKFRVFGIPSKDATTHTGYGVTLQYDPYTGILDSTNGSITLVPGYLRPSNPLDIPYGGTGATTPAEARTNLEITPANIGAVSKTGDIMTGTLTVPSIELGNQASGHGGAIDFHYSGSAADFTTRIIENSSGNLLLSGSLTIEKNGLWVQGGSPAGSNNSRMGLVNGIPDAFPYNTSRRGVKIYSNAIALADPYNGNSNSDAGWIRHLEETGNSGVLEIGVGDDGDESIVARQYNTSSSVARTLTLLDSSGNTIIPRMLLVASTGETGSYDQAAMQIREYNYAGVGTGTWGQAPRLAWHWSGRVAAQIGLATDGYLYTAPVTGTNFYKLMFESGTWGINITGNSATASNLMDSAHNWNATEVYNYMTARVLKAGDTMTGDLFFANSGTGIRQIRGTVGDNDYWRIAGGAVESNAGYMEIATADDGNESIYVRQYQGVFSSLVRTLTLLDGNGNTLIPGTLYWDQNHSYYWNGNSAYSGTYYTNNWFRSYNNTGWFNETYGGGIFMEDSTWVKVYNGKSFLIPGNLYVNSADTTGGGIILSNDGDIVDLNDGYCSMRFSYGVRILSGNRSGSAVITLGSNGTITSNYCQLDGNGLYLTGGNGWIRTYGGCGWYNESYGGGIHMTDADWVRIYNGKGLHVDNTIEISANGHTISIVAGTVNCGIKVDGHYLCFRANGANYFPNN